MYILLLVTQSLLALQVQGQLTLLVFLCSCHPLHSFNPSASSSIGVSDLSPMVGCNYLNLSQSAVGRGSNMCHASTTQHQQQCQGLVPIHGMDSKLGWSLDRFFISICSMLVLDFFFLIGTILGKKYCRCVCDPFTPLEALSVYQRWSLQVPFFPLLAISAEVTSY